MLGWFKKNPKQASSQQPTFQPTLPLDVLNADFVADPYPTYAWLRTHCPVVELAGGGFLVTRYADIQAALTDQNLGNAPSRFSTLSARNSEKYVAADLASHISPFLDGAEHVKMRQMTSRAFFDTLKVKSNEIETHALRFAQALRNGDDLIAAANQPFAIDVMCDFCGIDADPSQMKRLTQAFFHLFAPLRDQDLFAQVNATLSDFRSVIDRSLANGAPENSLLGAMKRFQAAHDGVSIAQIIDNCLLVFADGVENIEAGAASLLMLFDQFDVFSQLKAGEIELEQAIREGLRLQTPAQLIPRVAKNDCKIGTIDIKKDMPVFLALASGNRDDGFFDDPDVFKGHRDLRESLTFGQGRHRCIGEPLAMLQLNALVSALVNEGIRPISNEITYQERIGHRWPQSLLVKRV